MIVVCIVVVIVAIIVVISVILLMIYLHHHGKPNDFIFMNYHQLNSNINGSVRKEMISIQQMYVPFFMLSSNRLGGQKIFLW